MYGRMLTLGLAAGLVVSAASFPKVGPNFTPPKVEVPAQFSDVNPGSEDSSVKAAELWWTSLGDPQLNDLIKRTAAANLDVKLATERVLEARASRLITRSALLPTVENNDSFQRIRGGYNQGVIHVNGTPGSSNFISPFTHPLRVCCLRFFSPKLNWTRAMGSHAQQLNHHAWWFLLVFYKQNTMGSTLTFMG